MLEPVNFKYGKHSITMDHYNRRDRLLNIVRNSKIFYEIELLEAILKKNIKGVYLDIGANIGNHTLFFAKVCPSTKVYSIEPLNDTYTSLKKNIQLNNLESKVKTINLAMSDKIEQLGFVIPNHNSVGTAMMTEGTGISASTIDHTFDLIDDISIIKIDVEEFEVKVIDGAIDTLKKHHPLLVIEIKTKEKLKQIDDRLFPLGYSNIGRYCATPTYIFQ